MAGFSIFFSFVSLREQEDRKKKKKGDSEERNVLDRSRDMLFSPDDLFIPFPLPPLLRQMYLIFIRCWNNQPYTVDKLEDRYDFLCIHRPKFPSFMLTTIVSVCMSVCVLKTSLFATSGQYLSYVEYTAWLCSSRCLRWPLRTVAYLVSRPLYRYQLFETGVVRELCVGCVSFRVFCIFRA